MRPIRLRQLCTLLYEQNKGSVVLVCSGTGNEYSYALGSGVADMRALSKALNGKLSAGEAGARLWRREPLRPAGRRYRTHSCRRPGSFREQIKRRI